MQVNLLKSTFIIGCLSSLMACSSADTKYSLPSYYESNVVSSIEYKAGCEYFVDDLKYREQRNNCTESQSNDWVAHRTYRKQSFFE